MGTVNLSGKNHIDSLLWTWKWGGGTGEGTTVTYSFPDIRIIPGTNNEIDQKR